MLERLGVQNEWRDKSKLAFAKLQKMLDPSFKFDFADPATAGTPTAGASAAPDPRPAGRPPRQPPDPERASVPRSQADRAPAPVRAPDSVAAAGRAGCYLSQSQELCHGRGAARGLWQESGQARDCCLTARRDRTIRSRSARRPGDTYADAQSESQTHQNHTTMGARDIRRWRSSMVEQLICNQQVAGSSPIASSVEQMSRRNGLFWTGSRVVKGNRL